MSTPKLPASMARFRTLSQGFYKLLSAVTGGSQIETSIKSTTMPDMNHLSGMYIYIYFDYIYYMDLVYPNSKTTNDSLADRIIQMFALVDNTWNSMQKDLS